MEKEFMDLTWDEIMEKLKNKKIPWWKKLRKKFRRNRNGGQGH